jgi:hypothetical protein
MLKYLYSELDDALCVSIAVYRKTVDCDLMQSPLGRPAVEWPSPGEAFIQIDSEDGSTTFALPPPDDTHVHSGSASL